MRLSIDEELGTPYSAEYDKERLDELPIRSVDSKIEDNISNNVPKLDEAQEEADSPINKKVEAIKQAAREKMAKKKQAKKMSARGKPPSE
ncbi:MAG: hypothetical protein OES84_00765 [Kiritimatiellaceae bacterium]|nr:hypothetical protein [Kiritimatiellaceae bacterium]